MAADGVAGFDVVSVGECMVELARGPDGRFGLGVGGDTFNTAVYLARAGLRVAYATAIGDDPYSALIATTAADEGVSRDLVVTLPGRMPGLYLIETSAAGERSFWYWRDRAPARELFELADGHRIGAAMAAARAVYLSGVTLSLYSPAGLERLAAALATARTHGARVAMDSNYRPRGWGSDGVRARAVFERFWRLADLALPTFDDEQALWSDADPGATADRLAGYGAGEIVVKNGPEGALVRVAQRSVLVPCLERVAPVDTTAAGDSFNAGYLAARLRGAAPEAAAHAGHRIAAAVIAHRGAIVAREVTAGALTK
jgi:2-dehydro-3-deoxygluconokinase